MLHRKVAMPDLTDTSYLRPSPGAAWRLPARQAEWPYYEARPATYAAAPYQPDPV